MLQNPFGSEKPPACFERVDDPKAGVAGWNPGSPECAGGLDPSFKNEVTGSHIRNRCVGFQACGNAVQAKKVAMARGLIEPRTLLRPTVTSPVTPPQQQQQQVTTMVPNRYQGQVQQLEAERQVLELRRQIEVLQRGGATAVPQMVTGYQQMMPVNYSMPAYLTVPEPVEPHGFWGMLSRTVVRSVGKSVGHSVAHLFDTIPFTPPRGGGNSSGM